MRAKKEYGGICVILMFLLLISIIVPYVIYGFIALFFVFYSIKFKAFFTIPWN
jgi:hypothetical protein